MSEPITRKRHLKTLAATMMLTLAICGMQLCAGFEASAAQASDNASASSAEPESAEAAATLTGAYTADGETASLEAEAVSSPEAGSSALLAINAGTLYANNASATSTTRESSGITAASGSVVVGNGLSVETTGSESPAIEAADDSSFVSLASSSLSTTGNASPAVSSAGTIELDNVTANVSKSNLISLEGLNKVIVSNSKLVSSASKTQSAIPVSCGVALYQAGSSTDEKPDKTAVFQATGSDLTSDIDSGALFYLTNTQAKVVLSNTKLNFDTEKAKLIVASGNDAGWGQAGGNGATATVSGISQKLEGDIEADATSKVSFYLLSGSSWKGSANIVDSGSSSANADHLDVSLDATSVWIVTEDSTVSNLNLAPGAKLVDESGKAVKVADSDGNVLVEGASSVTVSVATDFSTSISTSAANALESASIDRAAFDEQFGISTTFGENGSAAASADEQRVAATKQAVLDWFANLA